jgi:hypothetical protein
MKTLVAAAVLTLFAGCASAPDNKPTHYWESASKATENRYRVDNLACQADSQAQSGSAQFEPGSESFGNYQECMISRGYVLRQY